jgi:hypothetical protein
MTLAKALRLKPGKQITFGDHKRTALCSQWWHGTVIHVTPNGGIKVKVTDAKPWYGPKEYAELYGNEIRWVPYTHVMG